MPSSEAPATEPSAGVAFIRDLVNTVEWQVDDETWTDASSLRTWLTDRLETECSEPTLEDLVLARRIREGLREVLLAHAGHEPLATAIDDLNDALARRPLALGFDGSGSPRVTARTHGAPDAVSLIVEALDEARGAEDWSRLKACSRDSCRWAYWDGSRNRSGRWCSAAGCGNFIKMRRRNNPGRTLHDALPTAADGERSATLVDVAARAGVSIKTVSNVVNERPFVADATRERVQRIIDELDYRPNLAARALASGARAAASVTPG
ncbi:LacI family DNA-binding transcriptional regulator [Microbacterium sp. 4R-513]|uniref:CGNR zinc finger domain-containing protein n=1 Tax=Microbacterium sp. 4R-513 TaxID=2567934 RepID=UPI0013E10FB3|nr:LacI family DNA-binding transcriptional regulator [Microbacterium sp. 4R-513]